MRYYLLFHLLLFGLIPVIAQELLISEDFSSVEWESELHRLNPGNDTSGIPINPSATNPSAYTTPAVGGGNSYQDLNNTDLYFNKYKLNGAIESLDVLPCPLGSDFKHVNIEPIEIPFADPTVFRDNGKFYLTGTRPGSPLGFIMLESSDMKNWQLSTTDASGMILKKGDNVYGEDGFWAPQIFKHQDEYHITYTASKHVAIATSETVNGKFTQKTIRAIDPDVNNIDSYLFRDDDGKYYLYHVRFNRGNYIWVAEFDIASGTIDKQTLTQCFGKTQSWEATSAYESAIIMEGPTVIKRDGIYYLFYSANHFKSIDYAVGYAMATSPMGPWTKAVGNPIIHRSIVGENGSGHGDLFFDESDNPYYVYHVHQSETTIAPRKTRIVPLDFTYSTTTERYAITAKADEIITPKVRATNEEQFAAIESNLTGPTKSVAFRLQNQDTGLIELPEIPNAGEITLHIRNGNFSESTSLALEKLEQGNWKQLHVFNLQNWGAYPDFRDEVLRYQINSPSPTTLRLVNNVATTKRYINLYRIDVTGMDPSSVSDNPDHESIFTIENRIIKTATPISVRIYDLSGQLVLKAPVQYEYTIPTKINKGIYIVWSPFGKQKLILL